MAKEIFEFKSVTISPNPVNTSAKVLITVELDYHEPYLDYPHDYPFDYKQNI